jgi:hypothetical protein
VRFEVVCAPVTALVAVSNQDQIGKAGRVLEEPLMALGADGVANLTVETVRTWSEEDGLARVSAMPLWLGPIQVVAKRVDSAGSWSAVEFRVDASDPGAQLVAVSGDEQSAKPGQRLEEPLVVRLADGEGQAVPNVDVIWSVNSATADFGPIGIDGSVAWWFAARTNAKGRARALPIPRWFGPISIEATSLNVVEPVVFTADASDPAATVRMVSGNDQEGRAGEPLAEPLVVRLTDGEGRAVPNIPVVWVAGGDRESSWWSFRPETRWETDAEGFGRAQFTPLTTGTVQVTAEVPGIELPALFEADVTEVVIQYTASDGGMFSSPTCLVLGYCDSWESVPLGATVEWVNLRSSARLVSTSVPTGGTPFDSGDLTQFDRFRVAPDAAGTWEYTDLIHGSTGTLYVH